MIPRFNVSDHSISVLWPVNANFLRVTLPDNILVWHIPPASAGDCFGLVDELHAEPLTGCKAILGQPVTMFSQTVEKIGFLLENFSVYCARAFGALPDPLQQILELVSGSISGTISDLLEIKLVPWITLLSSVSVAVFVNRIMYRRSRTGILRIGYSNSARPRDYFELPTKRFPDELLSDESIVEAMLMDPSISSVTLLRY